MLLCNADIILQLKQCGGKWGGVSSCYDSFVSFTVLQADLHLMGFTVVASMINNGATI